MNKYLIIIYFLFGFLTSLPVYAASCGGGGGGKPFTIPTTPEGIASAIKQLQPQMTLLKPSLSRKVIPTIPIQLVATPVVAKVVWLTGTVKAMGPDKKIRLLQPNAVINLNDAIITAPNSQVEIVFSDHTIMTFMQNTFFYVKKYEFHPEKKAAPSVGSFIMDLLEGGFRTVTGIIAKTNSKDYKVNTDVAIMGVRGTDYSAFFHACRLDMKRHKGTPTLQNAHGTIALTASQPYAAVPAFNQAPTFTKGQAPVFAVPLTIKPATFPISDLSTGPSGGGGGSGGSCAPLPGQFSINFH